MRNISTKRMSWIEFVRSERTKMDSNTHQTEPIPMAILYLDRAESYSEASE